MKNLFLKIIILLTFVSLFCAPVSVGRLVSSIDYKTIICLFCLMVSIKGIEDEGILEAVTFSFLKKENSLRQSCIKLVSTTFFFSMILTNDVTLLVIVPLTIKYLKESGGEDSIVRILVLQTIAANIGSSLTPIGNPQNLYLVSYYSLSIFELVFTMLPIVLAGALILLICCMFQKKQQELSDLQRMKKQINKVSLSINIVFVIIAVAAVFGLINYWITGAVVLIVTLIYDSSLLKKINWDLLLIFFFLFILVSNITSAPVVGKAVEYAMQTDVLNTSILLSQFISNVPAAVFLSQYTVDAVTLLQGVCLGGLGTPIASMASLITYNIYISEYKNRSMVFLKSFTVYNMLALLLLWIFIYTV